MELTGNKYTTRATFGAGCFWGVEMAFQNLGGVIGTTVGYMGGHLDNPTYQDVCTGRSGHAEVVQVTYNPTQISFDQLLQVFWNCHNPTEHNRQGPDIGTQYRSVIFFHSDEQRVIAETSKENWQQSPEFCGRQIVTKIIAADTFYPAEEHHQQYLLKRGMAGCRAS